MENYEEKPILARVAMGTVYLIHLGTKFHHAQHYIGWASNVAGRLYHHRKGTGARFLAAVNQAGISYEIVREWPGDKQLERKLKNRKNASLLCPVCQQLHHFRFAHVPPVLQPLLYHAA
jgi:predicted GIY-YIG superfamily endonuclease